MAYSTTAVPVAKSQEEIRKLLYRHGARRFNFHEGYGQDDRRWAAVEFVHADENLERPTLVRIAVPLKAVNEKELKGKFDRSYSRLEWPAYLEGSYAQEERRIWRVLHWSLKARLEAVEEELETFEQAFLPHIVDPVSGGTIWQLIKPEVDSGRLAIDGPGLALMAGSAK